MPGRGDATGARLLLAVVEDVATLKFSAADTQALLSRQRQQRPGAGVCFRASHAQSAAIVLLLA